MFQKGKVIENKCYRCGNKTMKIYDVAKGGVMAWVKCQECGAVDDIFDWDRKAAFENGELP